MKQRVETEKFYPAYPVFVLTYLNEIGEPQMSTGSSSYTLGDSIVIGVSAESNASKHLHAGQKFAVNFPNTEQLGLIEQGGFSSGKRNDKIKVHQIELTKSDSGGVAYIDTCPIVFECNVTRTVSDEDYHTIFAKIDSRLFEKNLMDSDGHFIHEELDLVLFSGDANERKFRQLDTKIETLGGHS
ncbi:flavin reductase family protein [Listeria monocytogenes]|nr:flavin reductase family protein [Listeria monocytogenes]EII0396537.1 flavin reductase family protein [Listeria monocytogenes]EIO8243651.1 flavin reductase family protein [Listeria monocytogenes]EIS4450274.1 flavin reductase family protein [Listeria monocytogenes]